FQCAYNDMQRIRPVGFMNDFSLFASDDLKEVGGVSDADPFPLGAANDLPSPGLSGDAVSPVDSSPFHPSFTTSVYLVGDGVESVPPDFEVRKSAVTRGTLGVWSRRRLEVGEHLGPYERTSRHSPDNATQPWEVGSNDEFEMCSPTVS
uniref:Uncharacterized protein n=1 Tax=Sinocyclocheilus grahami TaxID=75366 RepID=A0A672MET3_SINGR